VGKCFEWFLLLLKESPTGSIVPAKLNKLHQGLIAKVTKTLRKIFLEPIDKTVNVIPFDPKSRQI